MLVAYSDAGLRVKVPECTQAGYGGFVFEHDTSTMHYFHGQWDASAVNRAELDINELETLASGYAADVAAEVAVQRESRRTWRRAHTCDRERATRVT